MRWMAGLGFMFVALALPGCRGSHEPRMGAAGDHERIAAYLAEPGAVDRAELRLTDAWFTDMIPPGGGITKLDLVAGPKEYPWQLERTYHHGKSPPTRSGTLDDSDARSALRRLCTELLNAGFAETPERMQEPEGILYFEAHRYSLELAIQGRYGDATMHRGFPRGLSVTHKSLNQLLRRILRDPTLEKALGTESIPLAIEVRAVSIAAIRGRAATREVWSRAVDEI